MSGCWLFVVVGCGLLDALDDELEVLLGERRVG